MSELRGVSALFGSRTPAHIEANLRLLADPAAALGTLAPRATHHTHCI